MAEQLLTYRQTHDSRMYMTGFGYLIQVEMSQPARA